MTQHWPFYISSWVGGGVGVVSLLGQMGLVGLVILIIAGPLSDDPTLQCIGHWTLVNHPSSYEWVGKPD